MKQEILRLAGELKDRLPEHTYKAVVRRANALDSDEARRDLLTDILQRRERSEKAAAAA